jgi:hypothetical protein
VNSSSYLAEGGDYEQQAGTKQKGLEDEIELGKLFCSDWRPLLRKIFHLFEPSSLLPWGIED